MSSHETLPITDPSGTAVARKGRLAGVDATRGLALLGMMAVHALWSTDADGSASLSYDIAAGRSAAVFAVLAGVGIAFATGGSMARPGARRRGDAAAIAARALAIGAIGLLLGYVADDDLTAVILPYYAVFFLLTIPLLALSVRALAAAAVVVAVAVPVLSHAVWAQLPDIEVDNPTFTDLLAHPVDLFLELTLMGVYPAFTWTAYLCAGLAIGRLRLSSVRVQVWLLGGGLALAVGAYAASWSLLEQWGGRAQLLATAAAGDLTRAEVAEILEFGGSGTTPDWSWWWLGVVAPHTSTPLDLVHTTGVAMALLGAFLLLARVVAGPLVPLAAAGGMTLTLYTAHVVFMNSPLDVFGATSGYLLQVVAVLVFATWWRAKRGRGPLEAVVSALAARARSAAAATSQVRG